MGATNTPPPLRLKPGMKAVVPGPSAGGGLGVTSVVVEPTPPKPFLEVFGPYFTGFAAMVAATIAAAVALRSIRANRDNLVDQLGAQREIASASSRASVISQNRQQWVNGLRDDLSEFISEDFVIARYADADASKMSLEDYTTLDRRSDIAVERRRLLVRRIELRLNPGKTTHLELLQAVRAVSRARRSRAPEGGTGAHSEGAGSSSA